MKLALYGEGTQLDQCGELLVNCEELNGRAITLLRWENYDTFIREFRGADALLVLADGGEGLEAMNAAQTLAPTVPRAWFSEDSKLGPQAIRMGAAFFAPKPLTEKILLSALAHCGIPENYAAGARPDGAIR
jgi:hypothetical protein